MKQQNMYVQHWQHIQYDHDLSNHFDILSLSRSDRLKHYGLHFAKYVGRLARGSEEPKSRAETLTDAFLVALSTANALNQRLAIPDHKDTPTDLEFFDHAGRFADACEKIDHLEDFRSIAVDANANIFSWIIRSAECNNLDLDRLAADRRQQLAKRAVYAPKAQQHPLPEQ